jgi:hypothetical protein
VTAIFRRCRPEFSLTLGRRSLDMHRKEARRLLCSLFLLIAATTGLASVTTGAPLSIGWRSPTKTYQGYLSVGYYGTYYYVTTSPHCGQALLCPYLNGGVFYIETDAGLLIRLIFTCGLSDCTQSKQLPLSDGARVYVKGTLIEPSQWQPALSQPYLNFAADLYVLQYSNVT